MQITHYCNSFITATSGKTKIVCDPWVGFGEQNGWLSYPYHNKGVKLLNELQLPDRNLPSLPQYEPSFHHPIKVQFNSILI